MANRYWVGGTGTWDASSTSHWSSTTGGSSGASAPVAADSVFFNSNSGTGTCTTASGAVASNVTLSTSTLGLTLGAPITLGGTFVLTLGVINLASYTLTTLLFNSNNSNSRTIAFGTGKIEVTGNAVVVWQMSTVTNFTPTGTKNVDFTYAGGTGTRTITHGSSFGAGGSATTSLNFSITAGTDTVDMVTSGVLYVQDLNFTGFSGTLSDIRYNVYGNLTFSSGMTLTSSTTAISFVGAFVTQIITTAGNTLDFPLTFNGSGSTFAFQDALTQGSTRAFTINNGTVQLKNGVTSTVGAFATAFSNQRFLQSTTAGSQATLSQAGGTVNANRLTIKDINAVGGATWNAYTTNNNVDAGNNLGWDFSFQVGRYIYTRRKNKRILP